MSDYRQDFSKMLRQARTARGLTQQEVAEALHMTRSTYTYYESGRTLPDILTMRTLSLLFAVPPEIFFHPEKYRPSPAGKK